MAQHILQAYEVDIQERTEGLEHGNKTGYKTNVHEITPGVVYKDANVTVLAFNSHHGPLRAYGYRLVTPDRSIVISGDAAARGEASENCHQCDVLVHEVYTQKSFEMISPEWKQYRKSFHTSSKELAAIANKSKPGLLILYHREFPGCSEAPRPEECRNAAGEEQLLKEIHDLYRGKAVAAHDLDVY